MVRNIMQWMLVLGIIWWAPLGGAEEPIIPEVSDLRREADLVHGQKTPLLLMFYADHCVYCRRMEQEFLKPMLISGAYNDKVVIRRVRLDAGVSLRDFDGSTITGAELAARYNVFVTPTLLFLDRKGAMLTEKMVGLSTPDFFGGYLDAAIDASLTRLRGGGAVATQRSNEACRPMC